jgi:hypothetical protein
MIDREIVNENAQHITRIFQGNGDAPESFPVASRECLTFVHNYTMFISSEQQTIVNKSTQ